ncbi:hypothetical protein DERF_005586 [Dermatophagoides farinae]|uniref:Uncharacterized protein n=1 Tax=Dermatophagoides farinae TaxID=6954 RepID=A0A922LBE9_DERFA|nr:hypothetical protein DERF_005586 [Dermatophagoides farinae]
MLKFYLQRIFDSIISIINVEQFENSNNNDFPLFDEYFHYLYSIIIHKNKDIIRKIYWKMFIIAIWSSRFLYLYIVGNDRSYEWRLIHFDIIIMAKIDNIFNVYFAAIGWILVYLIYVLLGGFRPTKKKIFINYNTKQMKNINDKNVDYSIENYNNQDQRLIYVRHIRLWIRIYQQIFQMTYYFIALFVSITNFIYKFKQIKTRWMKKNYESINFDIKLICKIRNRTIQLLILTESVDRTYAVLMFLIILVNGPMNAYVTMIITIKSIPFTEQLLFLSMSIYQWSFIFLFHYTAIRFGQNIHYPSKYFINHYYSLNNRIIIIIIMGVIVKW